MDSQKIIANNEYFIIAMALFVGLYASFVGSTNKLPSFIRDLFNNPIFRILILSVLLIHNFGSSPHVALAVVLIFTFTMYTLRLQEVKENFIYLDYLKTKQNEKK